MSSREIFNEKDPEFDSTPSITQVCVPKTSTTQFVNTSVPIPVVRTTRPKVVEPPQSSTNQIIPFQPTAVEQPQIPMCFTNVSEEEQIRQQRYQPSLMYRIKDAPSTLIKMLRFDLHQFPPEILVDNHDDIADQPQEGHRIHSFRLYENSRTTLRSTLST